MPVDMRGWLPEDDLVFIVLDAMAAVDLGGFCGLFSQVLRLLAAENMVSLGLLSLDGTELADNAAGHGRIVWASCGVWTAVAPRTPRDCGTY
jgi:hypothetical protein